MNILSSISFFLLVVATLTVACSKSNVLDAATAQSIIQNWIDQKKTFVEITSRSTPLECRQALVNTGYIKTTRPYNEAIDGSAGEPLESTGKLPQFQAGLLSLPLYKAKLLNVSSIFQVVDAPSAQVTFSWEQVPINSDVPSSCLNLPAVNQQKINFTLTTNGWIGDVQ